MITSYEDQYIAIAKNILENGYYDNNRTGMPTYKLPHQIMSIDLEKEFPILKSKQVFWKTAVKEGLWIYKGDNNVRNLEKQGIKIWTQWANEEGTIGRSYGYQIKQFDQINNLIKTLKENPQDRRMMINLWNFHDLPEMTLPPCVISALFDVTDGRLNCLITQRSGDWQLGICFDILEYAVLTHLLAQLTGFKVGKLTHVISNAHIYENQIEGAKKQIANYNILKNTSSFDENVADIVNSDIELWINPDIKNFDDFTIDDIQIRNYKHMGKIPMPVSV